MLSLFDCVKQQQNKDEPCIMDEQSTTLYNTRTCHLE